MCVHHKTYTKFALQVGVLFGGLYVLCFFWPAIRGLSAELSDLHLQMWQIAFFGFSGFNAVSFISGLVQSFIYGLIAVGVWRLAGLCCGGGHGSVAGDGEKEGGACCK